MVRHIRWFAAVLMCLLASTAYASPASELLFRGVKTSLGDRDKEAIAKQVDSPCQRIRSRLLTRSATH